jgi:hypothetical protein
MFQNSTEGALTSINPLFFQLSETEKEKQK